jgi:dTDP-4-amino-4,6-dideoxygalactose transaminase
VRLERSIDRDALAAKLQADGIDARVYYPNVVADMDPYLGHPRIDASLPIDRARAAATSILSLPVHPGITSDDISRIAEALPAAIASTRGGERR